MANVYIATQSGSSYDKKSGETFTYTRGVTRVVEGHVLLKLAPDYFKPAEDGAHYGGIETATAPPAPRNGERESAAKRVATKVRKAAKGKPKKAAPTAEEAAAPTPDAHVHPHPAPGGITLASLRGEAPAPVETAPAGEGD